MFQVLHISFEVYIIVLAIAVFLFFLCRWILIKMKVSRSWLYSIIISITIAPLIYLAFVSVLLFSMFYYPDKSFDRDIWLTNKETRYEYSKSLKKNHLLKGKTKQQVRELLGDPDREEADVFVYYIGFKPQLGVDPDYLKISFKNNLVSDIEEYNS